MRIKRLFTGFILILCVAQIASAQEKSSYQGAISVDFSYGYPFYVGDFNALFGQPAPYINIPLTTYQVYNPYSLSGSISYPFTPSFHLKIKASHTAFNYTAPDAFLHFKNTVIDVALLPAYRFNFGSMSVYGYAGGGYNFHDEPTLFESKNAAENQPNTEQGNSFSVSGGVGFEYRFLDYLGAFIEGDVLLPGSDKIDGFNGNDVTTQTGEAEKPKLYFSRDKLITARAGIRVYLTNPAKPVGERPYGSLITSYYDDPTTPEAKAAKEKEKGRQLTEREKDLGVELKLNNYTLEVYQALSLDELERAKENGKKHLSNLRSRFPDLNIFLLAENLGYTLHFGTFQSYDEAKDVRFYVRRYYGGARVRRH